MFKFFRMAAETYGGTLMVQKGADILINRHTDINVFLITSHLRKHADNLIKEYYKDNLDGDLTENEAALLKLGIWYANAEKSGDEHMMALLADGIRRIRDASEGKIRHRISLEVMAHVGT
ncbi:MAG: hypothetical protein EOM92_14070 [Gammaproteobacteria bacterium]|nr:hypothetical protein [Gammaproteobacteria bacterium]